jgi:hypothetical protein
MLTTKSNHADQSGQRQERDLAACNKRAGYAFFESAGVETNSLSSLYRKANLVVERLVERRSAVPSVVSSRRCP